MTNPPKESKMSEVTGQEGATGDSNAPTEQVTGNTGVTGTGEPTAATTPKPVVNDQPAVNYETKYKELQRAYTQETQRRSSLERQWSTIESRMAEQAKTLAELRKQPYDREKFLAEFQEKGPDVLKPYWEENINGLKEEYNKTINEQSAQVRGLQTRIALNERRSDSENYPDFRKLEPVIVELMNDPNNPVDFTKPIDQVIDVLYQLARQTSSAEAIRQAEASGQRKAESNLVRESKTTVTGGGKAASITKPDPSKMSLSDLRAHAIELNGVADRD